MNNLNISSRDQSIPNTPALLSLGLESDLTLLALLAAGLLVAILETAGEFFD